MTDVDQATELVRAVTAKLAGPQVVWVLISSHSSGITPAVWYSEDAARQDLARIVRECIDYWAGDDDTSGMEQTLHDILVAGALSFSDNVGNNYWVTACDVQTR